MKVILGKNPNTDFRVIGENGNDITDELCVKSIQISADANNSTMIVLECYGEAEAEGDLKVVLKNVKMKP